MTREQAIATLKGYLSDYASKNLTKSQGANKYVCPYCHSGEHKNNTGAFTIIGDEKEKFFCFSCNRVGDIFDLIGEVENIPGLTYQINRACRLYNITIDDYRSDPAEDFRPEYQKQDRTERKIAPRTEQADEPEADYTDLFLQANQDIEKTDYHRGISLETLNRFKIGFIENWTHPKAPTAPPSPRLIIPTSKGSYLARDTRANLTDKQKNYSKSKVGKIHIFNIKALKEATTPIFVVEGEIDALSIIDVGGDAIGLGSVSMTKRLLESVSQNPPSQPLIIALDNDKAGQKASTELAEGLKKLGISYIMLDNFNGYKDANEALQSGKEAFTELVRDTSETAEDIAQIDREELIAELKKESTANSLEKFKAYIKDSEKVKYYPTGFNELDKMLDGGLFPGLYVVGAISSLGKTTFCMQVADQIAQAGNDVIIFSLEMSRNELIAKSISRLTYIHNKRENGEDGNAKTTRGILTGTRYKNYSTAEKDLIARSIEDYSYYSEHIYINEGIGDIGVEQVRERIARHTRITGKAPVVIIDYLQILAPYDTKATDKQNTDKAVLELKRLSRDYNIPIIGISSFNRDNYLAPVNLASFKESGAIEYSSDVLFGLQYEGMDYKRGEKENDRIKRIRQLQDEQIQLGRNGQPQKIQVKILKNRNGSKGDSTMEFIPMFNYFYEAVDFEELDGEQEPWETL